MDFRWVLMGFTGFYGVLLSFTGSFYPSVHVAVDEAAGGERNKGNKYVITGVYNRMIGYSPSGR